MNETTSQTKFGRLTYISSLSAKGGKWLCLCDCGKEKLARRADVVSGNTRSCGCLRIDSIRSKHSHAKKKNETKEYICWKNMKSRCLNPKNKYYFNYGGRGIKVCERWAESYSAFIEDMGMQPSKAHTIDRIETDGNYEPSNCRWSTQKEQCRNKRNNVSFVLNGKLMCVTEIAETYGLNQATLARRLRSGKTIKQALAMSNPREALRIKYLETFGDVKPSTASAIPGLDESQLRAEISAMVGA